MMFSGAKKFLCLKTLISYILTEICRSRWNIKSALDINIATSTYIGEKSYCVNTSKFLY